MTPPKRPVRKITLDIETTGEFGPNNDVLALDLAIACIHDSATGEYSSFTQEELPRLWPILESADLLIGYNSDHFDIPILNKYYSGDLTHIRSIDLLKEVRAVLGRRLRMDNIAEATLGKKKSGNGAQAVKWWNEGRFDEVRAYCIDDVRITLELYDYVRAHGSLRYTDYDGVREIKIRAADWEKPQDAGALTHTLPF